MFRLTDSTTTVHRIPFELVHNLIVVPGWINSTDTLWFILDTGVQANLLTEWPKGDSLSLKLSRKITVTGLGDGAPLEAWLSWDNHIRLPGVEGFHQDLVILTQHHLPLSSHLGRPIHGILGYPFFSSFDLHIDYWNEQLVLYPPGTAAPHRKMDTLDLIFYQYKPYTQVGVAAPTQSDSAAALFTHLLIDLGASHAVSLSQFTPEGFIPPPSHLPAFLGRGLSGSLQGTVGRIPALQVGRYCLCQPLAVYPDSSSFPVHRDTIFPVAGSVGGEIWQRFDLLLSYKRQHLYLKPNAQYKSAFYYNTSGLEIINPVPGFPIYVVERVLPDSPADRAGLQKGDQIVKLNGFADTQLSFPYLLHLLNGKPGKTLRITYLRHGEPHSIKFKLEDAL